MALDPGRPMPAIAGDTPPSRHGEAVAGVEYNRGVDSERDGGGGQQHDQAVDWEARFRRLEEWHADLEDEVVRLRGVVADFGARAAQTVRPTNTP